MALLTFKVAKNIQLLHSFQPLKLHNHKLSTLVSSLQHDSYSHGRDYLSMQYNKHFHPNPLVRYSLFLKEFTENRTLFAAKSAHAGVIKSGLESNISLQNKIIHMYVKIGILSDAQSVFDSTVNRDSVSWNIIMTGYAKQGYLGIACHLFDKMPAPNLVSWNTIINGCVENGKEIYGLHYFVKMVRAGIMPDKLGLGSCLCGCGKSQHKKIGEQSHAFGIKCGLDVCVFVANALIDMYGKCRDFESARKVFLEISQKNVVSWTSLISGSAQNGQGAEAVELFCEMIGRGITPDDYAFSVVLSACGSMVALETGRQVHGLVVRVGMLDDLFVGNALVSMYTKCGGIEEGCRVFEEMPVRDVVSWNSMILGYAQHGHGKLALEMFDEMLCCAVHPDEATFVGVLNACTHVGLVEEGLRYFVLMQRDYKIMPGLHHFACAIDLLGRAGRLDEVEDLLVRMPFAPDAVIWSTLLSACRMHGNARLAKLAVEKLMVLEPGNKAAYLLLANMYAANGN